MGESDLYIDYEVLDRVRSNLNRITEILRDPGDTIERWGTGAAGVDELSDRLGEFDDEWSYGIGKINEFAGNAADALHTITEAWRAYDLDLAEALEEARNGS